MDSRDAVAVERNGSVATVVLDNVAHRNALTVRMWQSLAAHFLAFRSDTSLRYIVVCGANGQFSGGADISEFPRERDTTAHTMHFHMNVIAPALAAIATAPQVTIAKIEGVCIGGGLEVAAQCDLRLCSEFARFGVPIAHLGFPMAPEEIAGLLQLIGRANTLELLLEGVIWNAKEARHRGLVNRVVPAGLLDQEVVATLERIDAGAPGAARINKWLSRRLTTSAEPLSPEERAAAFAYAESHDHQEGIRAFLERRKPRFQGS